MQHPYPNFAALAKLYACIPISSVDCERGFSTYSLIKNTARNRLHVSAVNTLMQMSVETPPLTCMDGFNFEKVFELSALVWNEVTRVTQTSAYNICMYRLNTLFREQLTVLLNVLA